MTTPPRPVRGALLLPSRPYPPGMDTFTIYLTQYYGTDWLAVAFMCVYLWRIADKHRDAFIWGALSNVFFVLLNIMIESPPGVVFNALFLLLNARAFMRWAREARN